MKVKSLLLIAAAAIGMTAAAQDPEVVVTNCADFLSLGDKDGAEVALTKGAANEVAFVWNKVELDKFNACQCTFNVPEGLTMGTSFAAAPEMFQAVDEMDDPIPTWTYTAKWDASNRTLLFVLSCVAGIDGWLEDANGDGKLALGVFKIKPDAEAADGLYITSDEEVAFWNGGYNKALGPKANIKVTSVRAIEAEKQVAGVKYYNVAGVESDEAFDGVNIVVTTYVDGSTKAVKVIK